MEASLFDSKPKPSGESLDVIKRELMEAATPRFPGRVFIFGSGDPSARVLLVGESPGPPDIATGEPFTGPVGDMLRRMLVSIGLRESDCYLTNVVKFVSQGSELTPEMIAFFTPFLLREIESVDPELIIALGATPAKVLLETNEPISKIRGRMRKVNGRAMMPTFNPAYLLRDATKKKEVWEDMRAVREFLTSSQR